MCGQHTLVTTFNPNLEGTRPRRAPIPVRKGPRRRRGGGRVGLGVFFIFASFQVALKIAQTLLSEYGVYTLVESHFNGLPSDVRYILIQYNVTGGLRIIFDAFATSLVMRFFNW